MRKHEVQRLQRQFEDQPETFRSFGTDQMKGLSLSPCSRAPAARLALGGHWRRAYDMWLKDGQFSRDLEEQFLAFILASERIVNRGKSAEVPMPLPMRVWNANEYTKFLNWYSTDKKFRSEAIAGLANSSGNSAWSRERVEIGTLIRDGMSKEAERIYWEKEWNLNESAECNLALIHSCPGAESLYGNYKAMWFFYVPGNRPSRPMTFDTLKSLLLEGRLMGNCFVWRKGFKKWTPVMSVNCLAPFVYADELPPPVPHFACEEH